MKTVLLLLLILPGAVQAAIEVRVSVKYILSTSFMRPAAANIGTQAGFNAEIAHGNRALANAGRGYVLRVTGFTDIRPSPPDGQGPRYWLDLPARDKVAEIEAAATADKLNWAFDDNAINVYINNSSSGSCCGGGIGKTIALGSTIFVTGTVVHEIGHMLGLVHTHGPPQDQNCDNLPGPLSQWVNDGDGLADTVKDRGCFSKDQLAMATWNGRIYDALTPAEQAWVNSSFLNVMSYHTEDLFTPDQMDLWTDTANVSGQFAVNGKTVFVDKNNTCFSSLPPNYASYQWWVDSNPLPQPAWGASKGSDITIDPGFPPKPPGWPDAVPWPPINPDPFGRPPYYPANWPWPPYDMPAITFCMGGPRKTVTEGMDQAAPGDTVTIRPGTYSAGARLTERLSLRPTRGNVRLHR